MKITKITPYLVENDTRSGANLRLGWNWLFVKVDTDAGISGWGECGIQARGSGPAMVAAVRLVSEGLIGENAADIERIWHKVYRQFSYLGSRGFGTSLAAGFDVALWDIKGKAAGMPIYDLLGGRFRDPVRMYCNVWFQGCATPEEYAAAAQKNLIDIGHEACKLDPFREMLPYHTMYQDGQISEAGEQEGYDIVAAVREVVGPKFEILIDAHGHYNVPTAIRLANNLFEQSNIGWFEEPLPPEGTKALKQVREKTNAPICIGERLYTRWDFLQVFENGLADFVMPDTIWTGGISEVKKIATMAEAYYIPIAPHVVPGGPIELIAAAHVVSTIPNFYRLEHAQSLIPAHNDLLQEPYEIKDGHLYLNDKPGLGFELDEEKVKAASVDV
ncbi:MAG: mandelate racemase/muconate lactonizing enzyme family protein [Chloroflexi bacterium]|nr:mandelate racemase/muconate lactonizing enzyme family protein [Chloroflexota bacterium]